MEYECSCPRGQRVTPDGKSCVDRNECLDNPCQNNGQCVNRDTAERYICHCPSGFSGSNCELMQEEQILRLSMGALAIILLCLLSILIADLVRQESDLPSAWRKRNVIARMVIEVTSLIFGGTDFIIMLAFVLGALLILVLVFVVYNRRREAQIKYPNPDDDVRENIINYEDEGGGEDDMTAFDITPLQIPVPSDPSQPHHAHAAKSGATVIAAGAGHHSLPRAKSSYVSKPVANSNVESFIEDHKSRADNDPSAPPFDDLRNYAYEGGGSTAGSLSSLGSDNDIGPF
ncbi:Neural-cadherin [Lepeophtheirus salmonis]|uniref:Neural-cadherin n=1 Tax=Lepeophtheirus salmonis TaxID=72036 RepID=A0A7R8D0H1_LEPSM|nr:Neural-cadherin [Lepeophtheirus salmonis]CAF2958629.1 Neural-cadherin [Lepeophtheirus salmonis]